MIAADIHHITRLRVNSDGDGVRSVIFVHGCPLNCFWCCNPETRFTDNFKTLTPEQLNDYIKKDKLYFQNSNGGVTFCGGEPLLYTDFIEEYIKEYCTDFSVNIETSLYVEQTELIKLLPLVNEWYIDFKIFDEQKHIEYTGRSNELIKENLRFLTKKIDLKKIIITFPMITDYNTSAHDMDDMITFLKNLGIYRIALHPYRKEAEYKQNELGLIPTNVSEVNSKLHQSIIQKLVENGFEIVERTILVEKEKCNFLKHIRREICNRNGIKLVISDCSYVGRCTGTCPQCEYELSTINDYISIRSCEED